LLFAAVADPDLNLSRQLQPKATFTIISFFIEKPDFLGLFELLLCGSHKKVKLTANPKE
jgi:hypothetical protein